MSINVNRSNSLSLERAADFIWRNARLLERAIFAHIFLGGSAESVTVALLAYRNSDGGLGNALEADIRAPISLPLHCESGLRALHEAGIRDKTLASGVCEFLASVAEPDGRVEIASGDISGYPRAAHWENPSFGGDSPNPTAGLVGLLWYQAVEHPWLSRAADWCWRRLERPLDEAHEIATALRFLEHAPDRSRAHTVAMRIASHCDRAKWYLKDAGSSNYGVTPIQLCPRPDSIARSAFADELLEAHLDHLAACQESDGGWPITWAAPGPGAAFEWRGIVTLEALISLRAYGRI
ncbi:MAG TPA: hypothetical protein VIX59_12755 [Candidatus Binataceae bacterium]